MITSQHVKIMLWLYASNVSVTLCHKFGHEQDSSSVLWSENRSSIQDCYMLINSHRI